MWTTEQVTQVSLKGSIPNERNMLQLVEKSHPHPSHIPVRNMKLDWSSESCQNTRHCSKRKATAG